MDELGRIMVPIELRRGLDVNEKDAMEFFVDLATGQIALKKYRSVDSCILCSEISLNMLYFKGKQVCKSCLKEVQNQLPPKSEGVIGQIRDTQSKIATSSIEGSSKGKWRRAELPEKKSDKIRLTRNEQEEKLQKLLDLHQKDPKLGIMQMAEKMDVDLSDLNNMIRKLKNRGEWK